MKADWSEGFKKKKQAGVQDMTLLSTITNESINENLKARFVNQEIYVRSSINTIMLTRADLYRPCAHLCQPIPRCACLPRSS